jgi:Flp pilus assembly protein TadD
LATNQLALGEVLRGLGDLAGALRAFGAGLSILDHIARADPHNVRRQLELAVLYDKIGLVLDAQGDLPEAQKSFREGAALRERLARAHPGNLDRQSDFNKAERATSVVVAKGMQLCVIDADLAFTYGAVFGRSESPPRSRVSGTLSGRCSALPEDGAQIVASTPQSPPRPTRAASGAQSKLTAPEAPRRTDTSVATDARNALNRGDIESAAAQLEEQNSSDNTLRNLLAVCNLRLGEAQQALDLLRPMIFPDGGFLPKESADPAWIVNFATALILRGDVEAARSTLSRLKDPAHPGAVRLHSAIETWEKSLGARGRFKRMFGGGSRKAFPPDFLPGVY